MICLEKITKEDFKNFLKHTLSAVLLGMPLVGCGTLTGTKQVTYIDSEPSHVDITRVNGEPVQIHTPNLIEIDKKSAIEIEYRTQQGTKTQVTSCSIRWGGSVAANTVGAAALSSIPLGALFFGVDFFKGGIYDCPTLLTLNVPKNTPKKKNQDCLRYLIVPSPVIQRKAVYKWQKAAYAQNTCHQFIYSDSLESDLEYFGLLDEEKIEAEHLSEQKWRELAFKNQTNALILLNEKNRHIVATEKKLNNSPEKPMPFFEFALGEDDIDTSAVGSTKKFLFYWLPNSLVLVTSSDRPTHDDSISDVRSRPSLLGVSRGFGFQTITHPDGHEDWNILISVSPSFRVISQDLRYKHETSPGVKVSHSQKYAFVMPGYAVGLDYFMPIGTFYLSWGVGPAFTYVSEDGVSKTSTNYFTGWSIGHRNFWSRNLYVFLQVDSLHIKGGPYGSSPLEIQELRTMGNLGLGIYLPTKALAKRVMF